MLSQCTGTRKGQPVNSILLPVHIMKGVTEERAAGNGDASHLCNTFACEVGSVEQNDEGYSGR